MCPVQNDQVRAPLTGPFLYALWCTCRKTAQSAAFGPDILSTYDILWTYQMDHSNLEDLSCIRSAYTVLDYFYAVIKNVTCWTSQNGYRVWKWKFHSELVATGFPFSSRNEICNVNVNPIPIKKINFRWEANHIHVYSHWEWYCHSCSFKIFQSVLLRDKQYSDSYHFRSYKRSILSLFRKLFARRCCGQSWMAFTGDATPMACNNTHVDYAVPWLGPWLPDDFQREHFFQLIVRSLWLETWMMSPRWTERWIVEHLSINHKNYLDNMSGIFSGQFIKCTYLSVWCIIPWYFYIKV